MSATETMCLSGFMKYKQVGTFNYCLITVLTVPCTGAVVQPQFQKRWGAPHINKTECDHLSHLYKCKLRLMDVVSFRLKRKKMIQFKSQYLVWYGDKLVKTCNY